MKCHYCGEKKKKKDLVKDENEELKTIYYCTECAEESGERLKRNMEHTRDLFQHRTTKEDIICYIGLAIAILSFILLILRILKVV